MFKNEQNPHKSHSTLYQIVSFYRFVSFPKSDLKKIKEKLAQAGAEKNIVGLILLSVEGINATVSGKKDDINDYLQIIEQTTGKNDFFYKISNWGGSSFKFFSKLIFFYKILS